MIDLLVMTDGRRDYIAPTIEAAREQLGPPTMIDQRWIHDDSGDPAYTAWLRETFPDFRIVVSPGPRSGFAGAIRSAWLHLRTMSTAPYVFHLEDDFVIRRPVNLVAMADLLNLEPWILQVALRRQPWNPAEVAAGGVVEQNPDDFVDRVTDGIEWLEHRRFFTTNPSLYRRTLIETTRWPAGAQSEGRYAAERFADPDVCSAYWGSRSSGEWCQHIGAARVGIGY